jgi:hypothetical protein
MDSSREIPLKEAELSPEASERGAQAGARNLTDRYRGTGKDATKFILIGRTT